MTELPRSTPTVLMQRLNSGDASAYDELMPLVYAELHRLAQIQMGAQRGAHTLQPTALVNEAYMRMIEQAGARFDSRAKFFALASRVMRSVLVDHARGRAANKRSGPGVRVTLTEDAAATAGTDLDLLALDEALARLSQTDEELARIVELRFFGGLTAQEAADALGMSLRSLERGYQVARMWLARHLAAPEAGSLPRSS